MNAVMKKLGGFALRLDRAATRHRLILGALLGAALSGALALMNVSMGPLSNLNDIGGWDNRLLFIAITAAAQCVLLLLCTAMSTCGFARLALRQLTLTAGLYILLLAINQKTYAYVNLVQPIVRAMDEGGLAAGLAMETSLSAPALTLLYAITRGPVYDMYLVKLFAIFMLLLTALLAVRAADRQKMGIRAEALLALLMILPQGFMSAACCAQTEIAAVALTALSLTLAFEEKKWEAASAVCYALALAVSGAALYALPVYIWLVHEKKMRAKALGIGAAVLLACCVPAMAAGMNSVGAVCSLLRANLSLPEYASGAPNVMSFIPRAVPEEMPEYFMLRRVAEMDTVTNAQVNYTKDHFAQVMRGVTLAALAAYMGVCALVHRGRQGGGKKGWLQIAMVLTLAALLVCPAATMGAWLAADMLCIYAVVAAPKLRLPACMVLFATAGANCYPMTEEVLLPGMAAFALCALALCMLLGVIPMSREALKDEGE